MDIMGCAYMGKYREVLKNKNFLLLFIGQWVSELGSNINYLGLTWLVLNVSGDLRSLGLMFVLLQLPSVMIGPFAGVWVDRLNKKHIIVISDFARGILSIMVFFITKLEIIYAVVFISSIFDVFFRPSISGILPKIVKKEELFMANAASTSAYKISKLIGPSLGGLLIGVMGAPIVFLLNGLSFIFSGVLEIFITYEHFSKKVIVETGFFEELKEGLDYVLSKKIIKFVVVFFAIASFAFGPCGMLNASYMQKELLMNASQYGFAMTLFGFGSLAGVVILSKFEKYISEMNIMVLGIGVYGICYAIFGMAKSLPLVLICFVLTGVLATMINISYGVYLQKNVDEDKLGRVFSIDMALGNSVVLASIFITGLIGNYVSSSMLIVYYGAMLLAISCAAYWYWINSGVQAHIETTAEHSELM